MRQLLFTGFNAFGQHKSNNAATTSGRFVTEIHVPGNGNDSCIIALSWRYTVYAVGHKIWLMGLLEATPGECLELEAPAAIKALAAGDAHCLVLLQNGQLYKLAVKLNAQLQQISLETPSNLPVSATKRTSFGLPKEPSEVAGRITHIACGSHINVAISAGNTVYSIPSILHQFPQSQWRLQQLECGQEHALLLNANGDVYTWGNGLRGQLGQAKLGMEETPQLVEALAGIKITHIAAGGWHSAAISAFDDLYTWGLNSNGQLGMRVMKPDGLLKEPMVYPLPQLPDLPLCCGKDDDTDPCAPVQVFAGTRHTLLIRRCGRLWGTGWCDHGQLGMQFKEPGYLDVWEPVFNDCNSKDFNVICGPWSTLLVSKR